MINNWFDIMIATIRYEYNKIIYLVWWHFFYPRYQNIKVRIMFELIFKRLKREKEDVKLVPVMKDDMILKIMERYARYYSYQINKESRNNLKKVYDSIIRISEETGIPQWELRARIQSDFGIDI
jgi:hypothetical protein